MRVLIVDDEERYRTYLRARLAEHGHDVCTVDCGRAAIDQGVRFHPDVLVADWMLRDSAVNGLRVAEVLQAVDPRLQTILITAFASRDLEEEAGKAGIFRFLEKPFELEEMVTTIEQAWAERSGSAARSGLAALELDSGGAIVFANDAARSLLLEGGVEPGVARLDEVLGDAAIGALVDSNEGWIRIHPAGRARVRWWARSRTWSDGAILVLFPDSDEPPADHALAQSLLDTGRARASEWPFDEHVMVIDDVKRSRSLCARLLEKAGCMCYKAETQELALRLFRADPDIGVVITDYEIPGTDLDLLISELKTIRPGVKIVGSSSKGFRRAFAALGVDRYLEKGWEVPDLIDALRD